MKDDRIYLQYILETIGRIEEYTKGGHEGFRDSTLVQDGVIRSLQTIGQSVIKMSPSLKESHPEINWKSIIGFRNVVVHDYMGINMSWVWEIVEEEIPDLEQKIEAILKGNA